MQELHDNPNITYDCLLKLHEQILNAIRIALPSFERSFLGWTGIIPQRYFEKPLLQSCAFRQIECVKAQIIDRPIRNSDLSFDPEELEEYEEFQCL